MTDSRSGEKSLRELEFNDLNIHLYLTLNYGTASEHLDFDFMVLYNAFVLSWGLTITQNIIHTISDLDRSRLSDTRSAENDRIGADTDPEYRIDASLVTMGNCLIWISLFMFFFPLIETVTYTCHYMTDRLERFDLKTSKLDLLKKKRHLHLGCPWGKLIDTKF